ncbi:MAG: hypothetical protein NZ740_00785 [Kiritimatiellae bacterium]|nr:hypothetical protein [Kiritimatiellia bacterium]MDW8457626.1 hypothetical protein [Verrucomicrobiota bacterium]
MAGSAVWAGLGCRVFAQGPHEIALIINQNHPDSLEIAHHYAQIRQIPSANLIYLDVPRDLGGVRAEISPELFLQAILEPVRQEIARRNLEDHILAWVYSAGFPVRVLVDPPISINGATFVRGQFPSGEVVKTGHYLSPFWRGFDNPGGSSLPSGSLQDFAAAFRDAMPMPSATLAYTANRGLTVEETIDSLRRSAAADGTFPRDPFYYHLSENVRCTARRWQFEGAARELAQMGISAVISSNEPAVNQPLSGLLVGIAYTDKPWGRLQPGSLVDNLTSFGAEFHHQDQVRLTHWLRNGASFASGTVIEPYSAWPKFAHARLFVHYARGCTALESYLQALRSPLQQYLVGDPLARPWARPIPLTLINLEESGQPLRGEVSFLASSLAAEPGMVYVFLLDGRSLPTPGNTAGIRLDTRNFDDGWHELRAIAYSPGPIRRQGHARLGFLIGNLGRSANLRLTATDKQVDIDRPFSVAVSASAGATGISIRAHERIIWSGTASTQEQIVVLNAARIGAGPVPLQAVAHFPDGSAVRSPPQIVQFKSLNRPPSPPQIVSVEDKPGERRFRIVSEDPDGDEVSVDWFSDRLAHPPRPVVPDSDGGWTLSGTGRVVVANIPTLADADVRELVFQMRTTDVRHDTGPLVGGIAWSLKNDTEYTYFGWHWHWNAWAIGRFKDGSFHPIHARGVPRPPRGHEVISLCNTPTGLLIKVDNREFGFIAGERIRGPFGLVGGPIPWTLTALRVAESNEASPPRKGMWLRASDGIAETWAPASTPAMTPSR